MTAAAAFRDGWRRVLRAPALLVGVWATLVLLTLPFALVVSDAIVRHLGGSLAAETAAAGVNFDWWNEFLAQTTGLGHTFTPSVIGFAAVLSNLGTLADGGSLPGVVALIVSANVLASTFLLGGILDRLARDRAIASHGFFAACGVFFFRFVRLGIVAAVVYAALFLWLHPWLFGTLYEAWTRDMTSERSAFGVRLLLYIAFAVVLFAANLLFDYAKIRMVVEDRRSAIGALIAGGRFLRRNASAAIALYLLNASSFALVLAFYFVVAPGAGGGWWTALAGFLVSQLYIALRIAVRLTFAASQIALFQGRLAHAGYTARAQARWPDSAAAAALRSGGIE